MKRLFVIGNGFDLFFDLPTEPKHFVQELEKIPFHGFDSAYDAYCEYGVEDWSKLEQSLSKISLERIDGEVVEDPDYLSDHEYDREDVILNVQNYTRELLLCREKALRNMLTKAEEKIEQLSRNESFEFADFFDSNCDYIINFNYTTTIESLFNYAKEVLHIHGYFKNEERLVFGYGERSKEYYQYIKKLNSHKQEELDRELQSIKEDRSLSQEEKERRSEDIRYCFEQDWNDPYIDNEYKEIVSFYEANRKDYQFEKLRSFLKTIGEIDEVLVLGHSLGAVDKEYFEIIEDILHPLKWTKSSRNPCETEMEKYKSYSFSNKILLDKMENIFRR